MSYEKERDFISEEEFKILKNIILKEMAQDRLAESHFEFSTMKYTDFLGILRKSCSLFRKFKIPNHHGTIDLAFDFRKDGKNKMKKFKNFELSLELMPSEGTRVILMKF